MKNAYYTLLFLLCSCGVFHRKISPPDVSSYSVQIPMVENIKDSLYYFEDNYLIRNQQGIWELYLSGNPLQLGLNSGALTQRLYHRQDSLLFSKLKDFVPSERAFSIQSALMPRFRNTNRLKVRNKVNTKLNDLLIFMALGDASFWPSTVMNIFL